MFGIIKNFKLILFFIVIVGFLFRFVSLETNPASMHADEADTGYTALTLIKTGMDPYGNKWPLHFQNQASNYRAPLYTYSTIPFVLIFGLNPIAERLPSVIFGTLLILVVYALAKLYFRSESIALAGAFVIAISPWSIHLSRTGLEVELSLLLTTSGLLLFEMSKLKKYYLILSAFIFALSLFSYHPAKIFTPLILIVIFLFNFSYLKKIKYYTVVSLGVFILGIVILGYLALFDKGVSRLQDVSIFDSNRAKEVVDLQRTRTNASLDISFIFNNKPIYFLREFTNMYIGPLSINYLFINGESNLDKGIGNYGQFHLFELVPLLIGIYMLWRKNKKTLLFLTMWIFIGFVPAGITTTGNYAYRDVNVLVPFVLLIAYGFVEGYKFLIKRKFKSIIYVYGIVSFGIFSFFVYNYYFSYPVYSRDWWGYSQKEALEFAVQNREKHDSIVIDGGLDWVVLFAFYNNIDPVSFQKAYKSATMVEGRKVIKLEGIYFGQVVNNAKKLNEVDFTSNRSLLIVPANYFKNIRPSKYFYAVDGGINLKVYETVE